MSIKITEIELSKPLKPLRRVDYQWSHVWVLVRLHGEPLGWVKIQNEDLPLSSAALGERIIQEHSWIIYDHGLRHLLDQEGLSEGRKMVEKIFKPAPVTQTYPKATALVFLPYAAKLEQLASCLEALQNQDHPDYEVIVACNGTVPGKLPELVEKYGARLLSGTNVFYRALVEASADFISITGPMAVPDRGWLRGVAQASLDNPAVTIVCGLMLPYQLFTQSEIDFESHAKRPYWFTRYYNYEQSFELAPENFGTPQNISFRRSFLLEQCNNDFFALDFGLKQMLFLCYRALKLGYMVGYEPRALVWERYPETHEETWEQLARETRERTEFLAMSLRHNPGQRKVIWEKLKASPAFKGTMLRLVAKNARQGLKGRYASRS
jgi:GT2 family glycosyltransferase